MYYSQKEIEASWKKWDMQHWAQVHTPIESKRPAWDAHIKASWEQWDVIHLAHLQEPSKKELYNSWKNRPAIVVEGRGKKEKWQQLNIFDNDEYNGWMKWEHRASRLKRENEAGRNFIVGLAKGWLVDTRKEITLAA